MSVRVGHGTRRDGPSSPLCQRSLLHTDQVLGLARDLVPREAVSPSRHRCWQRHYSSGPSTPPRRSTNQGDAGSSGSPLRSYAKGKNSLWLLNSESYSSVTMKMLIEKQAAAAAAAQPSSPSRLEAFAADSPPRRWSKSKHRETAGVRNTTGEVARGGAGQPHSPSRHANPGRRVPLATLISATTPPKTRSRPGTRMGNGIRGRIDEGNGAEARRSLAQETYTKTFSGMQAYGESGMTVLEELIDAAFRACDLGHSQGQQRVTGAALLTRSGKIYSGYNIESASVDLTVGAERTTVLKAVSEGEIRFRSLVMVSDTDRVFPSPDGPGRQFLAEFGEFPIYLVNGDMQVKIVSTGELYPMMPPGPGGRAPSPSATRDEAIVAAGRARQQRSPRAWGVQEVLDWLEDDVELGEYRREFSRAKVDGALLLNLEDTDLHNMLGITHPLHRRRICLGVQKVKDAEREELGKTYVDMDKYVRHLDRDRINLITKLKVVFDRFDRGSTGTLLAVEARAALEHMGRDVTGEACASWLADMGKINDGVTFVDFTTAYSALFVDEDPDVNLGRAIPTNRKGGVSVTGSGHVRLNQRPARDEQSDDDERRITDERGAWAEGNSEGEEEGSRVRHRSPRKARSVVGDKDENNGDDDGQAFEALRSVKKLAEVKRVFDRFAVDGMLTANEALQALTEAGCTAPRTHVGRYLRSRHFFGLRREVTFFEFLRSMAALGLHDSGAHVAGFAPSFSDVSRTGRKASSTSAGRAYSRRRRANRGYGKGARRRTRSDSCGSSVSDDDFDDDVDDLIKKTEHESSCNSEGDDDDDDRTSHRTRAGRKRGRAESGGYTNSAERYSRRRHEAIGGRRRTRSVSPARKDADRLRSSPSRRSSEYSGRAERRGRARGESSSSEYSDGREREGSRRDEREHRSRSRERKKNAPSRSSRGSAHHGTSDSSSDASSTGGRSRRGGKPDDEYQDTRDDRSSKGKKYADEERGRTGDRERGHDDSRSRRKYDRDADRGRTGVRERPPDGREREKESAGSKGREGSVWSRLKDGARPSSDESNRVSRRDGRGSEESVPLREGDRVEARYRGKGTKFFKGKIARVNSDATFDVHYDDGDMDIGITEEHVKSLEATSTGGEGSGGFRFSKGDAVEAKYHGKGTKYYKGKISRVNSNGTLDIAYDDGDKEIGIKEEHVRSLEPSAGPSREQDRDTRRKTLREGDGVEGNYRGRGQYYKGRISRVNLDGTVNIDYDDGEKERGIAEGMIRRIGDDRDTPSARRDVGESGRGSTLLRGDKIEARHRGRGTRFYKGKIARVNSDNTFDIDYDDGEKERGLAAEHVVAREPPGRTRRDGSRGGAIKEGDQVEGNYKGRGRYFKGRISRVNLDGTFNIDYDDGEKERGVTEDLIRPIESGFGEDKSPVTLRKGDKVEAKYRGRGTKFYKGKIARVNSDATFDIHYDDGERDLGLAAEHVISLEPQPKRDTENRSTSRKLGRGDRVEARYRGRGTKFYKGKIARANSDGTFDINYDDGEKEIGISEEHVKLLETDTGKREDLGRSKLAKGDKVEARYRGRGPKFYKGRIARVNSDATFDIDYDDGEKEICIAEEHIRSLEQSSTERRRKNEKGPALAEGDKVEANFRGRGKFYTGRIGRINLDGTFNIDYDDGEKERAVPLDLIRLLNGRGECTDSSGGGELLKGDKIEARYRGRGTKFFKGTIVRVNSDETFDIDYDDGEKERSLPTEHVRLFESTRATRRGRERNPPPQKGDKVEANYRGRGRYYKGRISRAHGDGTVDIDYDDGERERWVKEDMIRLSAADASVNCSGHKFIKGDVVEAKYRGRGIRFYKGVIVRVNSDRTLDIDYDDGERERGIADEHVRSLEKESNVCREEYRSSDPIQEGDKVEANYRGQGRYYKGHVRRIHRDGTLDIDYDDGEKERNIDVNFVRSLNVIAAPSDRQSTSPRNRDMGGDSGGKLSRGDRVEARYRGRGTKFYKGKIIRVNSDATFDIDYDDGEKELGIAEEHVRSLELESRTETQEGRKGPGVIQEGDKIESNYRGRGRYYKGRVSRVNLDGTFNVEYDDGEKERGVGKEMIRSSSGTEGVSPSSRLRAAADRVTDRRGDDGRGSRLRKGDVVESRYRGKGTKFYKGTIKRVNSDTTFDIVYDDGDKERGIAEEHVRSLGSTADSRDDRRGDKSSHAIWQRGDTVEARYRGRGNKYFPGKIARVNSDATFDITYDDGDKDVSMAAEHIRRRDTESRNAREKSPVGRESGRLVEGDNVEGNLRGRGRYYKGRINRINSDGTFDIQYDHGEDERDVAKSMIRSTTNPDERESDRMRSTDRDARGGGIGPRSRETHRAKVNKSKLRRGDKVEARYRGRGTKFYKGRIARVNPDDTFDIIYDDGDKEVGLAEEHIHSLESAAAIEANDGPPPSRGARTNGVALMLAEWDRIEANYRGKGRFYKGSISRCNLDGTFNVDYDDGEKERGMTDDLIRLLDGAVDSGGPSSGNRRGGNDAGGGGGRASNKLRRGDRVEARYRGRGTKFYKGRIARVNSDATFDITYDDGDKEVGIAEEHVKQIQD